MIPELIIYIFIAIAIIFNILGAIGLHRFPDVYTRMHAATKCTTFGSIFLVFAVMVYMLVSWYDTGKGIYGNVFFHSIVVLAALLVGNSTGAHAIARAAYKSGVKPYGAVIDELEDFYNKGEEE